jgi:hypothetical protein
MTPAEFQDMAIALLGSAVGWQSAIARRLGIETRAQMARVRKNPAFGRTGARRDNRKDRSRRSSPRRMDHRRRVERTGIRLPRAPAAIPGAGRHGQRSGLPELNEASPVDIVSGVVYASDDYVLAEIDWVEVAPGEVAKWLEAAADAIDSIDD